MSRCSRDLPASSRSKAAVTHSLALGSGSSTRPCHLIHPFSSRLLHPSRACMNYNAVASPPLLEAEGMTINENKQIEQDNGGRASPTTRYDCLLQKGGSISFSPVATYAHHLDSATMHVSPGWGRQPRSHLPATNTSQGAAVRPCARSTLYSICSSGPLL